MGVEERSTVGRGVKLGWKGLALMSLISRYWVVIDVLDVVDCQWSRKSRRLLIYLELCGVDGDETWSW